MKRPDLRSDKGKREYLGRIVQNELAQAEGADSDELQANRAQALRYYFAEPRGDELEGRSQVISTDVADMVNATLAMLVPMLATDAVVEFEPLGDDDESQAQAESQAVNSLIIERNHGFIEIQEAVKDALLLRNGCMKIAIEDRQEVIRHDVSDADREQRAFLIQNAGPNEEREIEGDELTITTQVRRFVVSAVPIENVSYQAGYCGDLQGIRFFAERVDYTRSDLVELGVPRSVVAGLKPYADSSDEAGQVRNRRASPSNDAETRDQDVIECHEAYVLADLDGDGVSERYQCLVASRSECLGFELVDMIPYSLGSPFLNPHRITGESLFDHLKATQDVKTALSRQLIDNVTVINNGRYAYDPSQTAEEDVLKPRAGGGIRARNPGNSIVPIPVPDVLSGILASLNYEDKRRSERGGASLDLLAADAQLVGETAHGIERQYGSREALAAMMAANLSETLIRGIYLLTHEFLRRYAREPLRVRQAGQYVEIDPRSWPRRDRVNIKTGRSPGQRGHLQSTLAQHMQFQAAAMQNGMTGVLADTGTIFRTAIDWLRLAGVENPERLVIDPESPDAQAAAQRMAEQAQAAQEQAQAMQAAVAQIEQAKISEDARQHEGDLRFKYFDAELSAALDEARIAGQGVIDLEKARISHEAKGRERDGAGDAGARDGARGDDR